MDGLFYSVINLSLSLQGLSPQQGVLYYLARFRSRELWDFWGGW